MLLEKMRGTIPVAIDNMTSCIAEKFEKQHADYMRRTGALLSAVLRHRDSDESGGGSGDDEPFFGAATGAQISDERGRK